MKEAQYPTEEQIKELWTAWERGDLLKVLKERENPTVKPNPPAKSAS